MTVVAPRSFHPARLVISSRAPKGHLGIASVPLCTNQGCKSFVPSPQVDSLFLYYALRQAVPALKVLGSGATFAEVSKTQLEKFAIPLPPLAEQQRIAAILNEQMAAVDRARVAAEAQLAAAKELPAAYLRAVFGSPEAQTWSEVLFSEVCDGDGQYGISEKATIEPIGVPILRMGNIFEGRLLWDDLKYVSIPEGERLKYLLDKGDLLFNRTNSMELVGKSAVFDGSREAVFASYLVRFRIATEKADPAYVGAFINSQYGRKFIEANMGRAIGQVNVSASTMRKMPIRLPPLVEQQRIVAMLSERTAAVEHVRKALTAQLDAISRLPASLLRRAFAGEI